MKSPNFKLLAELHAIIDGIPDERFRLDEMLTSSSRRPSAHNCDTVGCALGWASLHPTFQALGLGFDGTEFTIDGLLNLSYGEVGTRLFDIPRNESFKLFCPAIDTGSSRSDKEIFKERVREFFVRHGQPVQGRRAVVAKQEA